LCRIESLMHGRPSNLKLALLCCSGFPRFPSGDGLAHGHSWSRGNFVN
jgi:hypothetical protein